MCKAKFAHFSHRKCTCISVLEDINLYFWTLAKTLPHAGFKWLNKGILEDLFVIMMIMMTLAVDQHPPKRVCNTHNDYL